MRVYPIVALGSGKGSLIEFFCKKIDMEKPPFEIKAFVTENADSGLRDIARAFRLPCHVVDYKSQSFSEWDEELRRILLSYRAYLVLLAGFLKKIGPLALNQFQNKIINSHPSLIPEFSGPGMYGLKVHQAVIQAKKRETGVTIHIVNERYDEGPVLAQKKIPVQKGETALELEKKVKNIEKEFYFETVKKIISGEIILK